MKRTFACLCMMLLVLGFAVPSPAETMKPKFISIGTAPTGASFYPIGVAMAQIIKEFVPGVNANAIPTGASKENINLLIKKEAQLGFVASPTAFEALKATGEYATFPPAPIQVVLVGHLGPWTLAVRKDSGIRSYADLKGKKIIADMPRASANLKALVAITETYGVQPSEISILKLMSINNAVEMVKEGRADGLFYIVTPGSAVFVDLTTNVETIWPSVTDDRIEKIEKKHPYYAKFRLPAGIFKGQTEPIQGISGPILICTHKDMDEELIYKITKAVFEHNEVIQKAHPVGKEYTLDRAASLKTFPFHPGAVKYYKEKKVW
jgi:TRAP transporter TAXI family solute receptor